jgi:hypothetical protein
MRFMLTFTLKQESRNTAIARFLETGGMPGPGAKLLGRWTRQDLAGGFVLFETEDPKALTAFARDWSDVCDLSLAPVLEDADLAEVLRGAGKRK